MIGCITHEMATYGTHKSARQEFIGIGVQHFSLYDSVQVMKSSILIFSPSPRPTDQRLQTVAYSLMNAISRLTNLRPDELLSTLIIIFR